MLSKWLSITFNWSLNCYFVNLPGSLRSLWSTKEHLLWQRSRKQDCHEELWRSSCADQAAEEDPWPGPHWHNHRLEALENTQFIIPPFCFPACFFIIPSVLMVHLVACQCHHLESFFIHYIFTSFSIRSFLQRLLIYHLLDVNLSQIVKGLIITNGCCTLIWSMIFQM